MKLPRRKTNSIANRMIQMSECHNILTFFLPKLVLAANLSPKQAGYPIGTDYDIRAEIDILIIN